MSKPKHPEWERGMYLKLKADIALCHARDLSAAQELYEKCLEGFFGLQEGDFLTKLESLLKEKPEGSKRARHDIAQAIARLLSVYRLRCEGLDIDTAIALDCYRKAQGILNLLDNYDISLRGLPTEKERLGRSSGKARYSGFRGSGLQPV
jgi:hypothetical protein